jgi:ATP-dependent DNA ligase
MPLIAASIPALRTVRIARQPAPRLVISPTRHRIATPFQLLFDCLAGGGNPPVDAPLDERCAAIERFHAAEGNPTLQLSPAKTDERQAVSWLENSGGAIDGVIDKPLGAPYELGECAMRKMKQHRTADCVVGGCRFQRPSIINGRDHFHGRDNRSL